MKLLYFATEDWYFCSHRLALAKAARDAGFEVTVVTRVTDHADAIRNAGLRLIDLPVSRGSINPLKALRVVMRLVSIYRRERPTLVHHIALKPILYGALAARFAGVNHVVNTLPGMGWTFSSGSATAKLLKPLICSLLRRCLNSTEVIVQNGDDAALMLRLGVDNSTLIPGSGVDVERFRPVDRRAEEPVVMLVARLIWDKGIREFVEASRALRDRGVAGRFVIVGAPDSENRSGVPQRTLEAWQREGVIEWWGQRDDMPEVLAQADIACLPSYREGMPKTLLEAAACGLPLVTTQAPGCRELVVDGENGLLVPAHDAEPLANALQKLLEDETLRRRMGAKNRQLAVERFADQHVIGATLAVYRKAMTPPCGMTVPGIARGGWEGI